MAAGWPRAIVSSSGGTPTWLDELNLDPRERVAAGLGTRVIQAQQDELVAQAWAQAGEIAAANQRRRQTQLAAAIGAKLLQRHVEPLTQGAPGQDDALWRFAAPAQARLMLKTPDAQRQPGVDALAGGANQRGRGLAGRADAPPDAQPRRARAALGPAQAEGRRRPRRARR